MKYCAFVSMTKGFVAVLISSNQMLQVAPLSSNEFKSEICGLNILLERMMIQLCITCFKIVYEQHLDGLQQFQQSDEQLDKQRTCQWYDNNINFLCLNFSIWSQRSYYKINCIHQHASNLLMRFLPWNTGISDINARQVFLQNSPFCEIAYWK